MIMTLHELGVRELGKGGREKKGEAEMKEGERDGGSKEGRGWRRRGKEGGMHGKLSRNIIICDFLVSHFTLKVPILQIAQP